MATHLSPDEMKALVRQHFEEFVNHKKAEVIRHNLPGGDRVGRHHG